MNAHEARDHAHYTALFCLISGVLIGTRHYLLAGAALLAAYWFESRMSDALVDGGETAEEPAQ